MKEQVRAVEGFVPELSLAAVWAAVYQKRPEKGRSSEVAYVSGLDKITNIEVYCFKNVGHKKPSPEFFDYILKDLGLTTGQVIMVGDNYEIDVLGANASGIRAIWFNDQNPEDRVDNMHRTVHDLRAIPKILEINW